MRWPEADYTAKEERQIEAWAKRMAIDEYRRQHPDER